MDQLNRDKPDDDDAASDIYEVKIYIFFLDFFKYKPKFLIGR